MAEAVYFLCSLTSAPCALLLARSYRRTRLRLLAASAFCFAMLARNNVLVFVDLVMIPQTDLSYLRSAVALVGLGGLLFSLVWDAR